MEKVAALSADQRQELFSEAAARKGVPPAIIEKDFWVCWTLSRLFRHEELSKLLMFKGGTSLSKVFHLIERFSEDIDLILDWRVVAEEGPQKKASNSQQDKHNKAINAQARVYGEDLAPVIASTLSPVCSCAVDAEDGHVINVSYPAAFPSGYLRPEVRLEIGPLASWFPFEEYQIRPYAAEEFPGVFDRSDCAVQAIKAERTFWEKATILHQEAHRSSGSSQPARYSRHYYDLAMMAVSDVKQAALEDLGQLSEVVQFKQQFYPSAWARYELAKPGSFRLIPDIEVLASVRRDYADMRNMIFGEYPPFEEMMHTLGKLESEINGMRV